MDNGAPPVSIGAGMANGVAGQCITVFSLASESFALSASNLGSSAKYIWAIGLVAAGEASTMTCTYAGQVVMGGMVEINLPAWKRVTMTRLIALVPSLIFAIVLCLSEHFQFAHSWVAGFVLPEHPRMFDLYIC